MLGIEVAFHRRWETPGHIDRASDQPWKLEDGERHRLSRQVCGKHSVGHGFIRSWSYDSG
jgi:hypothetical protein